MPRLSDNAGVKASVFDRLRPTDVAPSAGQALRDYRESVVRDLMNLFNTRTTVHDAVGGLEELERSLAVYGLPDLTSLNPLSGRDRNTLRRLLTDAIRQFEPRLTNVHVEPIDGEERVARLRFRITAELAADPRPIDISLDTVFEGDTRRAIVKSER